MGNPRKKIKAELAEQKRIHGDSEELRWLNVLADSATSSSQWTALTSCKHIRVGPGSYECRREWFFLESGRKILDAFLAAAPKINKNPPKRQEAMNLAHDMSNDEKTKLVKLHGWKNGFHWDNWFCSETNWNYDLLGAVTKILINTPTDKVWTPTPSSQTA